MKLKGPIGIAFVACVATLALAPAARASESLDPSFGKGGISLPGLGGASLQGLVQGPEGKLVGAGGGAESFVVSRYLNNGSLDESFGREKGSMTSFLGFDSLAHALALLPDGKILAAGSVLPGAVVLARYLPDGSRDLSFGRNGQTRRGVGRHGGGALDVAVLPGGRILAAGFGITGNHTWKAVVVAFKPNGEVDDRYSGDGISTFTAKGSGRAELEFVAMHVLPDGRLMVAGDFAGRAMVARLLPDGRPDPSFSDDGLAYANPDHCFCSYSTGLALDSRGRATVSANVVGRGDQPAALLRFLPDGRIDKSFGKAGIVRTVLGSRLASHDVVVQPNGRIVLVGDYNVPGSGEARVAVVRYLPNGEIDHSFGRRGFFTRDFGAEGVAYTALVQRDGRVVVGGRANPTRSSSHENGSVFDTAEVFLLRFLP